MSNIDIMDINELIERAREAIKIQDELYEKYNVKKDKSFGFNLPIRDFITLMQMLTPQSYGSRIQGRLIKELGFKPIKATKNSGDCIDTFGDEWEIKASIITKSNNRLNMVQIRPWQDVGYICVAFDTRVEPSEIEVYRLDGNQMKEECEKLKASSAHGTKTANENNKNIELRIDINIDKNDVNYQRWQNYRSNFKFS